MGSYAFLSRLNACRSLTVETQFNDVAEFRSAENTTEISENVCCVRSTSSTQM